MTIDNSELGPDEIDLGSNNGYDSDSDSEWVPVRKYWTDYLKSWEANIYYPVFAKFGISKAAALQIYELRIIRGNTNNEDDDDDDLWKQT